MKKCPNCGAQVDDNGLFCTECGKQIPQSNVCSHCGAAVNNDDAFCQNCGSKVEEGDGQRVSSATVPEQKYCPYCGAVASNDGLFCENCGRSIADGGSASTPNFHLQAPYEPKSNSQSNFILPIVIGGVFLVVLILAGGGWWYYKSSKNSMNNETQQDVTDSISVAGVSDVEAYSEKDIQEMKDFLEEFYGKMDSMGEIEESYIKENVTAKALRFLKENGYEYLTEYGNSVILNTIKHIDANTFEVCINYYISPAWFDSTIRICVVKENGSYKIDTIEKVEPEMSDDETSDSALICEWYDLIFKGNVTDDSLDKYLSSEIKKRIWTDDYDGCYEYWRFRTGAQDYNLQVGDISKVKSVINKGDGWYEVNYLDMGYDGQTKIKIKDHKIVDFVQDNSLD